MKIKRDGDMLEYRLIDTLELNYSKQPEAVSIVIKKLLGRPIKDFNLYPLSSFALEDALVVVQNGHSKQIKKLYLLNAHKRSFRIFSIRNGSEGDGSKRDRLNRGR